MTRKKSRPTEDDVDDSFKVRTRHVAKSQYKTRTLIKHGKDITQLAVRGLVVRALGPDWLVDVNGVFWHCVVSGTVNVPHSGTLIAVGDVVWVVEETQRVSSSMPTGSIVKVEERRTLLSRRAAGKELREQVVVANVDQLCIVVSFVEPPYHRRLIDRYLIAADKGDLTPIIVLNKIDLIPEGFFEDIQEDFAPYSGPLGIPVHFISVLTGQGLPELSNRLAGLSTLLSGPSGVGKSSIINVLTATDQRIGDISRKYERGKHTTSAAQLLPLSSGGWVVDSPGIREFGIWELDVDELQWYFAEFMPYVQRCRFTPCTHTHEPECEVKAAVERGEIDAGRYESYCLLREELETSKR